MRLRSNRFAILGLCLLPAVGLDVRTTHSGFVASFFYACPDSRAEPHVQTRSTVDDVFEPRHESAPVGVFLLGKEPTRPHRTVGEVEVVALGRSTNTLDMIARASAAARRLGGDALVEVSWSDGASARHGSSARAGLRLTARVARWD